MNKDLNKLISFYRVQIAKNNFLYSINLILQRSAYILIFLLFVEALFFLSSPYRINIYTIGLFSFFNLIIFQIFKYIFYTRELLGNGSSYDIGKKLSSKLLKNKDHLTNAIDLEKKSTNLNTSNDLIEKAVIDTTKNLTKNSKTIFSSQSKYILSNQSLILILILVILLFFPTFKSSALRLASPMKHFKPPTPFELYSLSKNLYVIEGDSASISVAGIGEIPKRIELFLSKQESVYLESENEVYFFSFIPSTDTTIYQASFASNSIFNPWDEISSSVDTIFLLKRPKIVDINFIVSYPDYTGINDKKIDGGATEIKAIMGSKIFASIKSNQQIESLTMKHGEQKISGLIDSPEQAQLSFILENTFEGEFIILSNGRTNLYPPKYKFVVKKDMPPGILILSPEQSTKINDEGTLRVSLQVTDDLGLKDIWIGYKIFKPSFSNDEPKEERFSIYKNLQQTLDKEVSFDWKLNNYNLGPGDEIHFYFYASDNKSDSKSPNISQSKLFKAYYPTLEDLFSMLEDEEESINENFSTLQDNMENIQNTVEEVKKSLLKSDEVDWDNQQQIEKSIEEAQNVISELENIEKMMATLEEQANENNLVSNELLKKFEEFQNMISSIITPEILEALEEMQSALDSMDPNKMLDAMENFEFNLEVLEEQIDDMMNLFKMAMAEQKLDELIKNMQDIAMSQSDILDSLANNDALNLESLSGEQRVQEEKFKDIKSLANEASEAIKDFTPELSEKLKEISNSNLITSTEVKLQNARKSMQANNKQESMDNSSEANKMLNNLAKEFDDIKKQFNEQTSKEIINEIITLLNSVIDISNDQELVYERTKKLKSRSPNLKTTLLKEGAIRSMNNKIIYQIESLSKKTFHISPQMAKAIGRTKSSIDKAISTLEQKSIRSSLKEQIKVVEGLNAIAKMLLDALNEIAMGSGASGFDSFMEQMNQLSNQQQGLNQSSMQLGKMGMMGQLDLMQQLQQKQEQLKNQLSQMMKDFPQQTGDGLSRVEDEMEDVIRDFKNREFNKETQDKQNRILSRLLDHQKSMEQRDYSDKRKANEASVIEFSGSPSDLPEDLGQLNNLIMQSLDKAMEDNTSLEYKDLTRDYFYKLYQEPKTLEIENEE